MRLFPSFIANLRAIFVFSVFMGSLKAAHSGIAYHVSACTSASARTWRVSPVMLSIAPPTSTSPFTTVCPRETRLPVHNGKPADNARLRGYDICGAALGIYLRLLGALSTRTGRLEPLTFTVSHAISGFFKMMSLRMISTAARPETALRHAAFCKTAQYLAARQLLIALDVEIPDEQRRYHKREEDYRRRYYKPNAPPRELPPAAPSADAENAHAAHTADAYFSYILKVAFVRKNVYRHSSMRLSPHSSIPAMAQAFRTLSGLTPVILSLAIPPTLSINPLMSLPFQRMKPSPL